MNTKDFVCRSEKETFQLGELIADNLQGGETILMFGGLGAGKTLLTKGMVNRLGYDVDDVTSPSFTLVNVYKTSAFDVYHVDLWRLDGGQDAAMAVGLDEILENRSAVVIIEWAERLGAYAGLSDPIKLAIRGDGEDIRTVSIQASNLSI